MPLDLLGIGAGRAEPSQAEYSPGPTTQGKSSGPESDGRKGLMGFLTSLKGTNLTKAMQDFSIEHSIKKMKENEEKGKAISKNFKVDIKPKSVISGGITPPDRPVDSDEEGFKPFEINKGPMNFRMKLGEDQVGELAVLAAQIHEKSFEDESYHPMVDIVDSDFYKGLTIGLQKDFRQYNRHIFPNKF